MANRFGSLVIACCGATGCLANLFHTDDPNVKKAICRHCGTGHPIRVNGDGTFTQVDFAKVQSQANTPAKSRYVHNRKPIYYI